MGISLVLADFFHVQTIEQEFQLQPAESLFVAIAVAHIELSLLQTLTKTIKSKASCCVGA